MSNLPKIVKSLPSEGLLCQFILPNRLRNYINLQHNLFDMGLTPPWFEQSKTKTDDLVGEVVLKYSDVHALLCIIDTHSKSIFHVRKVSIPFALVSRCFDKAMVVRQTSKTVCLAVVILQETKLGINKSGAFVTHLKLCKIQAK